MGGRRRRSAWSTAFLRMRGSQLRTWSPDPETRKFRVQVRDRAAAQTGFARPAAPAARRWQRRAFTTLHGASGTWSLPCSALEQVSRSFGRRTGDSPDPRIGACSHLANDCPKPVASGGLELATNLGSFGTRDAGSCSLAFRRGASVSAGGVAPELSANGGRLLWCRRVQG